MPFFTFMTLLLSGVALAQDPQVNSANPSTALQGTELDVEVSGSGFDNSAAVDFFVTGTTNPGGITVKKIKVRGSKKIIATIAIDAEAVVSDFDIEVRLSGSRTGKGTELFAVQKNDNGNGGQGSNTSGIVTFLTQDTFPPTDPGVFSDQLDSGNHRYVAMALDGAPDPDGPGSLTGDCASVVVPTEDGQDQGKAQLFVREEDGECPAARWILVRGSGFDLDADGTIETDELVQRKLMCGDTFSNGTSVGDTTIVGCTLFIETIVDGRVERTGRADWNAAYAEHVSADVRVVTATDADIYEYVAPLKGRGKKTEVHLDQIVLPLIVQFHRVNY
jgi:hypothetical protein